VRLVSIFISTSTKRSSGLPIIEKQDVPSTPEAVRVTKGYSVEKVAILSFDHEVSIFANPSSSVLIVNQSKYMLPCVLN
jgi:hypothetical protein